MGTLTKPTPKDAVDAFSDFVNNMSMQPKEFAELVMREHRTLQQSMFGVMLETIKMWAEMSESGRYDLRNEYTVKTSKKIMELLDNNTYTPFI